MYILRFCFILNSYLLDLIIWEDLWSIYEGFFLNKFYVCGWSACIREHPPMYKNTGTHIYFLIYCVVFLSLFVLSSLPPSLSLSLSLSVSLSLSLTSTSTYDSTPMRRYTYLFKSNMRGLMHLNLDGWLSPLESSLMGEMLNLGNWYRVLVKWNPYESVAGHTSVVAYYNIELAVGIYSIFFFFCVCVWYEIIVLVKNLWQLLLRLRDCFPYYFVKD